jgi:hypothetical protein
MSASIEANMRRWNDLKWEVDEAASAVICATKFIVQPRGGFPACNLGGIEPLWDEWYMREELLWEATTAEKRAARTFPRMPDSFAEECCFRMWAILIQMQVDVENAEGYTEYLRETKEQIAANTKCGQHATDCPCKWPKPPHQILASCYCAAEPCRCFAARRAEYDGNTSAAIFMRKVEAQKKARSTYDYTHHVETCPCGTCHKARVDSGTDGAYSNMCKEVNKPK